jgi:hypothetical protein
MLGLSGNYLLKNPVPGSEDARSKALGTLQEQDFYHPSSQQLQAQQVQ